MSDQGIAWKDIATPALWAQTASRGRWKPAKHLLRLSRALTAIATGRLTRLIVEMPPRHGKSELICRYFPTWYLGMKPDANIILASYEQQQAAKYGRYCRNLLNEWGPPVFGLRAADDSHAAYRWNIEGHEGGMFSTGVGGPATGKGANVLIIDDPIKNAEEAISETRRNSNWDWFESTAIPRLEPGGAAIVVQTRWHHDDLAGRCQSRQRDQGWTVLRMPALAEADDSLGRLPGEALWPERYPQGVLEKMRASMSPYWWHSLYQQTPSQHESVEWPAAYFDDRIYFDHWPGSNLIRTMALDPSKGRSDKAGDYSAFAMVQVADDGTIYADMDLARRAPEQIVRDGVELYRNFRPDVFGVESNAWQDLLCGVFSAEFRAQGWNVPPFIEEIDNRVSKIIRIRRLGEWLQSGKLRVRRNTGGRLLVAQLKEFPIAKHDDGPDALEMAIRLAVMQASGETGDNEQSTQDEYLRM